MSVKSLSLVNYVQEIMALGAHVVEVHTCRDVYFYPSKDVAENFGDFGPSYTRLVILTDEELAVFNKFADFCEENFVPGSYYKSDWLARPRGAGMYPLRCDELYYKRLIAKIRI